MVKFSMFHVTVSLLPLLSSFLVFFPGCSASSSTRMRRDQSSADRRPFGSARHLKKEKNCTRLNGVTEFEEYLLLSVRAVPARLTEEGLAELGGLLVHAYNETAYCDGELAFRTLDEAEMLPFGNNFGLETGLQPGNSQNITPNDLASREFTFLMLAKGSCNACGDDVYIFSDIVPRDPDVIVEQRRLNEPTSTELLDRTSSLESKLQHQHEVTQGSSGLPETRTLHSKDSKDDDDAPCVCEGPSSGDFLEVYNRLIEESISNVTTGGSMFTVVGVSQLQVLEGCQLGNFTELTDRISVTDQNTTVLDDLSEKEIAQVVQDWIDSYDQVNIKNEKICDPYFRQIEEVSINGVVRFSRRRQLLSSTLSSSPPFRPETRLRGLQTINMTEDPQDLGNNSIVATYGFGGRDKADIFLRGICKGCPPDTGFFDDVNDFIDFVSLFDRRLSGEEERRLQLNDTSDGVLVTPVVPEIDCFCPIGSEFRRGPTGEEFINEFRSRTGLDITAPRSITPVDCGPVSTFTATVTTQLTITGDISLDAEEDLEFAVQEGYNEAAENTCDPYFRTITSASLKRKVKVGIDVDVMFDVTVRCRNCDGIDALFQDVFRRRLMYGNSPHDDKGGDTTKPRMLRDDSQCYCVAGTPERGPTYSEFAEAFEKAVGNTISNVQPPTEAPTMLPSISPIPSEFPTEFPSEFPSEMPSDSIAPSDAPSSTPSLAPSVSPSSNPSEAPSYRPSVAPSALPSEKPSISMRPSSLPSMIPSMNPTNPQCVTSVDIGCVDEFQTPCEQLVAPSLQCALGSGIESLRFRLRTTDCPGSSSGQGAGFTCTESGADSVAAATGLLKVSCFDVSDSSLIAVKTMDIGGTIDLRQVQYTVLCTQIQCQVEDSSGNIIQDVVFNAGGTTVPLGLTDKFGALQVEACTPLNEATQDCIVPLIYTYSVSNIGTIGHEVTNFEGTRNGITTDLLGGGSIFLSPDESEVALDLCELDICSSGVAYSAIASVEADPLPCGVPNCFDDDTYDPSI